MINYKTYISLFEHLDIKKEELKKKYFKSLLDQYDDDMERATEDFNWFYDNLTSLNNHGGFIYRIVFLPDLKYLNRDDLGACWTDSEFNAKDLINNLYDMLEIGDNFNNYGDVDDGDETKYEKDDYNIYLIEADIPPNNIDFEGSVAQFCELPGENEINLLNTKNLKIRNIENYGTYKNYNNFSTINEKKYNYINFDYEAIQTLKGNPILYVIKYKIIKDDGEKLICQIQGYQYTKFKNGDGDDDIKKGWINVNDFSTNNTHILYKTDFIPGSAKRKVHNVIVS